MSHLPTERLAALVDEGPTAEEVAHLANCAECARERAIFRTLADLSSSESARIGSPLTRWEKLAPALVADGVIDDGGHHIGRGIRRGVRRPWLQAAAAALLVAAVQCWRSVHRRCERAPAWRCEPPPPPNRRDSCRSTRRRPPRRSHPPSIKRQQHFSRRRDTARHGARQSGRDADPTRCARPRERA